MNALVQTSNSILEGAYFESEGEVVGRECGAEVAVGAVLGDDGELGGGVEGADVVDDVGVAEELEEGDLAVEVVEDVADVVVELEGLDGDVEAAVLAAADDAVAALADGVEHLELEGVELGAEEALVGHVEARVVDARRGVVDGLERAAPDEDGDLVAHARGAERHERAAHLERGAARERALRRRDGERVARAVALAVEAERDLLARAVREHEHELRRLLDRDLPRVAKRERRGLHRDGERAHRRLRQRQRPQRRLRRQRAQLLLLARGEHVPQVVRRHRAHVRRHAAQRPRPRPQPVLRVRRQHPPPLRRRQHQHRRRRPRRHLPTLLHRHRDHTRQVNLSLRFLCVLLSTSGGTREKKMECIR